MLHGHCVFLILAIDAEKLAPYVDLRTAVLGENSIRVNVMLPEGIEQNENINVTVVVTEKNTSEPESDTGNPDTTPQPNASGNRNNHREHNNRAGNN